ncbi:MAG: helix-turn-helix domain-containing protein [Pseudomonadota bacterium]
MVTAHMLDISEVAHRSRQPASTIRYYEERGLIKSSGRRGLRRLFDPEVLDQLAFITLARTAGFTLGEMADMSAADGTFDVDRQRVREKADEIDRKISELTALSSYLRHVADCPAENHFSCPKFRRLLAAARRFRRERKVPR